MTDINYLYFYRNTFNGSLVQSTSPCVGANLVEMSSSDYQRAARVKAVEQETAASERADARHAKRAELAAKLGLTVEDLDLLR